MSNALSDWQEMHRALGKAPDAETAESWHKVHAQLLKSVADAQARLLAAQNETNDRLEWQAKEILGVNETLHRIRDRLDGFKAGINELERDVEQGLLGTYEKLTGISSRLDVILDQQIDTSRLAKLRRQVERIQPKRIGGSRSHVKRAVERKKHHA